MCADLIILIIPAENDDRHYYKLKCPDLSIIFTIGFIVWMQLMTSNRHWQLNLYLDR